MNIEMIIVSIAVVSLIFVPYFFLIHIGQREFRKISQSFKKEANKANLKIDIKDRWNQNAIGLDSQQQNLLFVQKRNEDLFIEHINLRSIAQCEISHFTENIKNNGVNEQVLKKITLELIHLDRISKTSISLFDSEFILDQDFEMKHAEKWKKIIENNLSPYLSKPKVA